MTPKTYRKKPVEIQAVKFDGDNAREIVRWMGERYVSTGANGDRLIITTLEGELRADLGDYVIRGVQGEFYPCRSDVFEATYEAVDQ